MSILLEIMDFSMAGWKTVNRKWVRAVRRWRVEWNRRSGYLKRREVRVWG